MLRQRMNRPALATRLLFYDWLRPGTRQARFLRFLEVFFTNIFGDSPPQKPLERIGLQQETRAVLMSRMELKQVRHLYVDHILIDL